MPLTGCELDQQSNAPAHLVARRSRRLNLTINDDNPCALMNLVVAESLAGREVERDRTRRLSR